MKEFFIFFEFFASPSRKKPCPLPPPTHPYPLLPSGNPRKSQQFSRAQGGSSVVAVGSFVSLDEEKRNFYLPCRTLDTEHQKLAKWNKKQKWNFFIKMKMFWKTYFQNFFFISSKRKKLTTKFASGACFPSRKVRLEAKFKVNFAALPKLKKKFWSKRFWF